MTWRSSIVVPPEPARSAQLGELGLHLGPGLVDLGQPRSGLVHHRGRGALHERGIAQLTDGPGALAVERLQLAPQPRAFLVEIEQALQGQVQLGPRGQGPRTIVPAPKARASSSVTNGITGWSRRTTTSMA